MTALLASLAAPASANVADASDGASLDLAGVTPGEARVDASTLELSGGFVPPPPGTNQVVEADATVLFSALANHTVVVAFTVSWCALCRGYQPEFARVAEAYEGLVDSRSKTPLVFAEGERGTTASRRWLAKTAEQSRASVRHRAAAQASGYVVDARGEQLDGSRAQAVDGYLARVAARARARRRRRHRCRCVRAARARRGARRVRLAASTKGGTRARARPPVTSAGAAAAPALVRDCSNRRDDANEKQAPRARVLRRGVAGRDAGVVRRMDPTTCFSHGTRRGAAIKRSGSSRFTTRWAPRSRTWRTPRVARR